MCLPLILLPLFTLLTISDIPILVRGEFVQCIDGFCYEPQGSAFYRLYLRSDGWLGYYSGDDKVKTRHKNCRVGNINDRPKRTPISSAECYGPQQKQGRSAAVRSTPNQAPQAPEYAPPGRAATAPVQTSCMNDFKFGRKLGKGSFGLVLEGRNVTNNNKVAIKLEDMNAKHPQLSHEFDVYRAINPTGKITGIPRVYCFGPALGKYDDRYGMAMELFGKSLEDVKEETQYNRFSEKTVMMAAVQMINRVRVMHDAEFLHRDLKPDNFVVRGNIIYIIDMGMAERYKEGNAHFTPREENPAGTRRYMAGWTHTRESQSRRNDMESLGFVFTYMLLGKLSWQGLKAKSDSDREQMYMDMKRDFDPSVALKAFHPVFVRYFKSVHALKYYDTPEYDVLVDDFRTAIKEKYKVYDYIFDWTSDEDYERNKKKFYGSSPTVEAPKKATTFMDVLRGVDYVRLAKLLLKGDEDVLFLKNMSDSLIAAVKFVKKEGALTVRLIKPEEQNYIERRYFTNLDTYTDIISAQAGVTGLSLWLYTMVTDACSIIKQWLIDTKKTSTGLDENLATMKRMLAKLATFNNNGLEPPALISFDQAPYKLSDTLLNIL